ncbi:MAG TPA: aminoglycoside phosphotransferase family protein [Pseudonocardiaceae bacterium]
MTAVSDVAYSVRPGWGGVPFVVQIVLEQRLGTTVVNAVSQTSGFAAGLASRLELADGGRVFVKGVPADHPMIPSYHAEAYAASGLPEGTPAPLLLGTVDDEWFLLVFEDVEGRHPDLRPGSTDLPALLRAVDTTRALLTPCPLSALRTADAALGAQLSGWAHLHQWQPHDLDRWARRNLDKLVAMESAWRPWSAGDTMLHMDLRPDNVLILPEDAAAALVDWAHAMRGAPWLELANLVPHLIIGGHSPAEAELAVLHGPAVARVPAWAITGFAAAVAGYWAAASRQPSPPGAYGLRAFQATAAAAALTWVAHRTRWP